MGMTPFWSNPAGGTLGQNGGAVAMYAPNDDFQQQAAASQQAYTQRRGQDIGLEQTKLPLEYQQSRFNAVWPYYQSLLSGLAGKIGNGAYSVGGQSAAPPHISAGPVYDQQTTQQQINQQRAQTDQQAAGQVAQQQRQLAGQGYGAGSPLAQLLHATTLGQAQGANANMATNLRFNSAQANSSQLLNSQNAQSNQWNQAQTQDIERRKTYVSALTGLLGGLGGLI